jgi:hypothetical protein
MWHLQGAAFSPPLLGVNKQIPSDEDTCRHRQVGAAEDKKAACRSMRATKKSCRGGAGRDLRLGLECAGPGGPVLIDGDVIAANVKEVDDSVLGREEVQRYGFDLTDGCEVVGL